MLMRLPMRQAAEYRAMMWSKNGHGKVPGTSVLMEVSAHVSITNARWPGWSSNRFGSGEGVLADDGALTGWEEGPTR